MSIHKLDKYRHQSRSAENAEEERIDRAKAVVAIGYGVSDVSEWLIRPKEVDDTGFADLLDPARKTNFHMMSGTDGSQGVVRPDAVKQNDAIAASDQAVSYVRSVMGAPVQKQKLFEVLASQEGRVASATSIMNSFEMGLLTDGRRGFEVRVGTSVPEDRMENVNDRLAIPASARFVVPGDNSGVVLSPTIGFRDMQTSLLDAASIDLAKSTLGSQAPTVNLEALSNSVRRVFDETSAMPFKLYDTAYKSDDQMLPAMGVM